MRQTRQLRQKTTPIKNKRKETPRRLVSRDRLHEDEMVHVESSTLETAAAVSVATVSVSVSNRSGG